MAKKKKAVHVSRPKDDSDDSAGGVTLKQLLSKEVLEQLKRQASLAEEAERQREAERRRLLEERKKQEQKKREQDFAFLLEQSDPDWRKYK